MKSLVAISIFAGIGVLLGGGWALSSCGPVTPDIPDVVKKNEEVYVPAKRPIRVLVMPFTNATPEKYQWYYSLAFRGTMSSALSEEKNMEVVDLDNAALRAAYELVKDGNVPSPEDLTMFVSAIIPSPTHVVVGAYSGTRSYQPEYQWKVDVRLLEFDGTTFKDMSSASASTLMVITRTEYCEKVIAAKFANADFCKAHLSKKKSKTAYEKPSVYDNFAAFSTVAKAMGGAFASASHTLDETTIAAMSRPATHDDMAMNRFVTSLAGERGYFSLDAAARKSCVQSGKLKSEKTKTILVKFGKKKVKKTVPVEEKVSCFITELNDALYKDPNYTEANLFLAGLYAEHDRLVDAKAKYLAVLAIEPENSRAISALAKMSFDAKEFQDAVKYYSRFTELFPASPMAFYWLGRSYEALGASEDAQLAYAEAAKLEPSDAETVYSIVRDFAKNGDYESAVRHLEMLTRLVPAERSAWYMLGSLQRKLNRIDDAAQTYRAGLSYTPNDALMQKFLDWVTANGASGADGFLGAIDAGQQSMKDLDLKRESYSKVVDELLWRVEKNNPERLKKCNDSTSALLVKAERMISEYTALQQKLGESVKIIVDAKSVRDDLYLSPDELARMNYVLEEFSVAEGKRLSMATQMQSGVIPALTTVGCVASPEVVASMPTSSVAEEPLPPATLRVVNIPPAEPPKTVSPRSPQFNLATKKLVSCVVQNTSPSEYVFIVDDVEIGAVPPEKQIEFLVPAGSHKYCLLSTKSTQKCGDDTTVQEAFFFNGLTLEVRKF